MGLMFKCEQLYIRDHVFIIGGGELRSMNDIWLFGGGSPIL
jgi:hypothetical protein